MLNGYDIAYGLAVVVALPYWLFKRSARQKVLRTFRSKNTGSRDPVAGPVVMVHAVSLGEVNATRALISQLAQQRPDLRAVLTTTTETGYARAKELYSSNPRVSVAHYPLDFSFAVNRLLNAHRPDVIALMELELWPNFLLQCQRRKIPVLLINGRLTSKSFANYKRVRPVARKMLSRLARICAQDQTYARHFIELGAEPQKVEVTGTMKFDTAEIAQHISGSEELAVAMGLPEGEQRIWVCGSTGPGEEKILLEVYRALHAAFPDLRLALVPRKPERFDEVADEIERAGFEVIRRSTGGGTTAATKNNPPIILCDTMGELRKFYSLADIVFVGRSLVDLGPRQHGSDMIEPAALAKPIIVGPFTQNFAEPMNRFRAANAIRIVQHPAELQRILAHLLTHPEEAKAMSYRAQEVVRLEQGATQSHVQRIMEALGRRCA